MSVNLEKTANVLRKTSLFSILNENEATELLHTGKIVQMDPNQLVVKVGDPSHELYIIIGGQVKVYQNDENGEQIELVRLKAGDHFGELALIDEKPRSASVETLEACEFFAIAADPFFNFINKYPHLLKKFLSTLTASIRQSNEKYFQALLQKEKLKSEAEAERRKSIAQMVVGIAHEMNTPLGIINSAASIISENLADKAQSEDLKPVLSDMQDTVALIEKNVQKLDQLIKSFKNLSVKQNIDTQQEVNIRNLLDESVSLYKLSDRTSDLDIQINSNLPVAECIWDGFPSYFFQVIVNLLSNIDKHAYEKGTKGKVEISLSKENENTQHPSFLIIIKDYGRGISKENLSRIFEPFFTTAREKGGAGLGLSIVYNLVTSALQGTIQFESKPENGTMVYLQLPVSIKKVEGRSFNE